MEIEKGITTGHFFNAEYQEMEPNQGSISFFGFLPGVSEINPTSQRIHPHNGQLRRQPKQDPPDILNILRVKKGNRTPERRLETPSKPQSKALSAFGNHVDEGWVLRGSAT